MRRLIPAHAGKTLGPGRRTPNERAHPRSRGENLYCGKRGFDGRGSSPLTRGKHDGARHRRGAARLIPAHAGKTKTVACADPTRLGSSPLTRGKRPSTKKDPKPYGLIPAHAGKTRATPASRATCWAHPRSRGENTITGATMYTRSGSSPLTRGKRRPCWGRWPRPGLIPAHAGKTIHRCFRLADAWAHPRSRGEN